MNQFNQGVGQYLDAFNNFIGLYVQDNFRASRRLTLNLGCATNRTSPGTISGIACRFPPRCLRAGMRSKLFSQRVSWRAVSGEGRAFERLHGQLQGFCARAWFRLRVTGRGRPRYAVASACSTIRLSVGAGLFPSAMQSLGADAEPDSAAGPVQRPAAGNRKSVPGRSLRRLILLFPPFPTVTTFDPDQYRSPVSYNWNLRVEHQLAADWLVRAAYVGNHGSHILETVQSESRRVCSGQRASINQRARLPP